MIRLPPHGAHLFVVPHTGSCLATVTARGAEGDEITDAVAGRFAAVLETLTPSALRASIAMGEWSTTHGGTRD